MYESLDSVSLHKKMKDLVTFTEKIFFSKTSFFAQFMSKVNLKLKKVTLYHKLDSHKPLLLPNPFNNLF